MYNDNFLKSLDMLFKWEGEKYHKVEGDTGGATKYGISLNFYKLIKNDAKESDIESLTKDDAISIYWKYFYINNNNNYHLIEDFLVSRKLFITSINMRNGVANKFIQKVCNELNNSGLICDGILGEKSINEINRLCKMNMNTKIIEKFIEFQINHYNKIVEKNESQRKFLKGWLNRANDF